MIARLLGTAAAVCLAACGAPPPCPSPPARTLAVVDASAEARALLAGVAQQAQAAGADPLVVVASGLVAEGDRAGGFLELPADRCVALFARASEGVGDVDLFAFLDDGGTLASDESSSIEAAIVLCAPLPERIFVSARVASGAGAIAIGAHTLDASEAPAVAKALGARRAGEDSGRLESWPGLEARIREHRAAIGGHWEDIRRFAAPVDPRAPTRSTVLLEPRRCLDVLVVPSDEAGSLEVVVETEDGRVAARAASEGRDRSLVLCSEYGELVTLSARPRGAAGLAAFVVGRSRPGASAELEREVAVDRTSATGDVPAARAALAARLGQAWGAPSLVADGKAKVGSRRATTMTLPAGCSRVDVVAGAPLGAVVAGLWELDGRLVHEDQGALGVPLFACGEARKVRIDVEARTRPGPYAVELRPLGALSGDAAARPLAAARLLARLADAGPADLARARGARVDAGQRVTLPVLVPRSGCVEAVAALDRGGRFVELRLVDDLTGDDALARGATVASQRLCGNGAPRQAQAELRVDQGPTEVLVVTRELAP